MKVVSFMFALTVDAARVRRAVLNQLVGKSNEHANGGCADAQVSPAHSECKKHVDWAMSTGIHSEKAKEWYPDLSPQSSFKEFQEVLAKHAKQHKCPLPCSKNVLMVIDMQRDYCIGDACGDPVDTVSKWASEHTVPVIQPIIDMMDKTKYDLVVFSQDSLKENEVCVENPDGDDWDDEKKKCVLGSTLVANTPGWEVIHALTDAAKNEFNQDQILFFTKNTDDAFSLLDNNYTEVDICTEPNCYPEAKDRKFDVAGEYDMPLSEVLKSRGFDTTNTHIEATGVLGNRCVMKSAIHVKHLGYDVSVVRAATGVAKDSENWYLTEEERKAGKTNHTLAQPPCADPPCDAAWYKDVYSGWRGGPAGDQVWEYLESAHVAIV